MLMQSCILFISDPKKNKLARKQDVTCSWLKCILGLENRLLLPFLAAIPLYRPMKGNPESETSEFFSLESGISSIGIRNPESGPVSKSEIHSRFLNGIRNILETGIRNTRGWNPEYSKLESGILKARVRNTIVIRITLHGATLYDCMVLVKETNI